MSETETSKKVIPLQLILALISSLLCFVAILVLILTKYYEYAIAAAAIQCFLFIICLLIGRNRDDIVLPKIGAEPPHVSGNLTEILDRDAAQIAQLKQEREDLLYANDDLTKQNQTLKEDNDKMTQLITELELKQVHYYKTEYLSGILPADEKLEDLDLIALTSDLITEMQPFCTVEGIRLVMSTASSSLIYHADARYIRLLIRNIIDNSIKYMKQAGSLVITVSNTGSNIFLAFKDNGLGISLDELPNIFELNFQGSNRVSGNGLGLAQVKAIVDHYGGRIYAHSENGMGIYIQLPLQDDTI